MSALRLLRHAAVGSLALGLFAASAPDASATHFRYGTLKWEITRDSGGTIDLKVTTESAWRRSFYSPLPTIGTPVFTGQVLVLQSLAGPQIGPTQNLVITPTAVNPTEDWFVGGSTHTFLNVNKTQLPARVFWQGNARISTLMDNNNDRSFRLEAQISADTSNKFSPSASILPIINVAYPLANASFLLPAADADGDVLFWSIAPPSRSQLVKEAPDGADNLPPATLTVDTTTGLVTWATNQEQAPAFGAELYAVQFLVRDARGGEVPVDALLRLVPNAGVAPVAKINGSETPFSIEVNPGTPVAFQFCGEDSDFGATVTLSSGGLPTGASMTPTLPFSGVPPRCSNFAWTPSVSQAGSHVMSFAVTDNFSQQDSISATVIVRDNFQPTLTCPAPVTIEAGGPTGASHTAQSTVADPDGDTVEVRWLVDGTLRETDTVPGGTSTLLDFTFQYALGAHPLRIEARDGITAVRLCDTSVTVVDSAGPVLSLPASQVLEATGPGGANATWPPPTAFDVVDGDRPVTCSHASGDLFALGVTTVTCSASDLSGNTTTGSFTITVQDTTPPVVTVPANMTLEATGPSGAAATFSATATDIVSGAITPTCAPASGSTFPLGTTTVTCSATDGAGNTGSASFTVTVVDTTPPVVTVPADMTLEATSPAGAAATFSASATDIVDGSIVPTCAPASGSTFALGTTAVTCTATDNAGNTGSASFTVTVVDTTPPVLSLPANMTVPATGPTGAVVNYTVTATDIVDTNPTIVCVPPSGSTFPLGTTPVNCTATDDFGNTSSGSFTVTVVDVTPPPVVVSMTPGVLWPPNHKMVRITVTVATEPGATCAITSVTSNEPVEGRGDGNTAFDWIIGPGPLDLQLRAERQGPGSSRIYTVTVTCTDAAGNVGTGTATAVVPHDMGAPGPSGPSLVRR